MLAMSMEPMFMCMDKRMSMSIFMLIAGAAMVVHIRSHNHAVEKTQVQLSFVTSEVLPSDDFN